MSVSTLLKGNQLFRSLSFEEVEQVSSFSAIKEFNKDETVFRSGSLGAHFFVLQEGRVDLRLPAEAHEASLTIGRINVGDLFGLRGEALDARIAELLAFVELSDRTGDGIRTLSGGMKRRLDLALALSAAPIRLEAPVPGRPLVGIEVPNDEVALVGLYDIMESPEFRRINDIHCCGKDSI